MRIDRGWRAAVAALTLLLPGGGRLAAQEAQPTPSASPYTVRVMPPAPVVDRTPRAVLVPGRPPERVHSAGAERLKGWRVLTLVEGEGRVSIDGAARSIKNGDAVDGYRVKSVGPGRIVLERPGELAIVTMDARGAARVLRVFDADPTPQARPAVPSQ